MTQTKKTKQQNKKELQNVELCISYCAYRHSEDENWNFAEEFSTKKEANQWLKEHDYSIGGKVMVCASAELGHGGACEFAYGKTQIEATRELNKQLADYGVKAVNLFRQTL